MIIFRALFHGFLLVAAALPAQAAAPVMGGAQTLGYALLVVSIITLGLAMRALALRQQLAETSRALATAKAALKDA